MASLQIWTNRLLKEYDGIDVKLPAGVSLEIHDMDPEKGICKGVFRLFVPKNQSASEAESGNRELVIQVDCDIATRYPFEPPLLHVREGAELVPEGILEGRKLVLPEIHEWTPSCTIVATLTSLHKLLQQAASGVPLDLKSKPAQSKLVIPPPGTELLSDSVSEHFFPCKVRTVYGRQLNRYFAVTATAMLELEAHRTMMGKLIVIEAYDLKGISKLKFRKEHSITILFKNGAERIFFLGAHSEACVEAIKEKLAQHGIDGRRSSNLEKDRQRDQANFLLLRASKKEQDLPYDPTTDNVNEIMDLYRQAAEILGDVDEVNHHKVINQMHAFLGKADVLAILEGNAHPIEKKSPGKPVKTEDIVLPQNSWDTDSDDGLAQEEARTTAEGTLRELNSLMATTNQSFLSSESQEVDDEDTFAIEEDLQVGEELCFEEDHTEPIFDSNKTHKTEVKLPEEGEEEEKEGQQDFALERGISHELSARGPNFFVSAFDDHDPKPDTPPRPPTKASAQSPLELSSSAEDQAPSKEPSNEDPIQIPPSSPSTSQLNVSSDSDTILKELADSTAFVNQLRSDNPALTHPSVLENANSSDINPLSTNNVPPQDLAFQSDNEQHLPQNNSVLEQNTEPPVQSQEAEETTLVESVPSQAHVNTSEINQLDSLHELESLLEGPLG